MTSQERTNLFRNAVAGLLVAYGFTSFFCFIACWEIWTRAAPRHPDVARGLIYLHNDHGSYAYFSSFQATAAALMYLSAPVFFVGALVAPRKLHLGMRGHRSGVQWEFEDPKHFKAWAVAAGIPLSVLFLMVAGPGLVRAIINNGWILNIG